MKNGKSTALGLFSLAGLAVLLAGTAFAPPSQAQSAPAAPALAPVAPTPTQAVAAACAAGGFDVCFPNLAAGAPNASCSRTEEGAGVVTACLAQVCRSAAAEPEPGFFSYCCARGGSLQYDEFCAFVVQSECGAVAEHCADRCAPLQLLTGTVTLAPPTAACLATYPAFIARVCAQDEFCCSTSWDELCAQAAVAARGIVLPGVIPAVISGAVPGLVLGATPAVIPAVAAGAAITAASAAGN